MSEEQKTETAKNQEHKPGKLKSILLSVLDYILSIII